MLRVVSRASPLAVYQANEVITLLEKGRQSRVGDPNH